MYIFVILLALLFFRGTVETFLYIFFRIEMGNGNLEYIFIHILLNGACWPQKRAIKRQMIFPNVLALIKLPAYYIFFFIMKPKV